VARRAALLRSAYLLTGSHSDAEDLLQIALVKVVPRWRRIADHPEPYVRKVLAREAVTRWRRRRWREVSTAEVMASGPVVHEEDHAATAREDLRRALCTLPPRQRAVVVLRYFEDLTEADTATTLGIAVGTVKSQHRDALARLRLALPGWSTDPEPAANPVRRAGLPAPTGRTRRSP